MVDSVHDVRQRSKAFMRSIAPFMTETKRHLWFERLEDHLIAFEKLDSSRDGSIHKHEFTNMLARLTADGGNMEGLKCPCLHCEAWSSENTGILAVEVDWKRFELRFDQNDRDGSGVIDFEEFVSLAEDRELNPSELHDIEALLDAKEKSKGHHHHSSDIDACQCFECQYRKLIGSPPQKTEESIEDLRTKKLSELHQKASRTDTVDNVQLMAALDEQDPKSAIIALLLDN
jgi:Ca2+-binding EF-hand superfamily protein